MDGKISGRFLSDSKEIIEEFPELKSELQRIMGDVADKVVRDRYVDQDPENDDGEVDPEESPSRS